MLNRWLNTVSIDIDADADASPQLIDGLMNLCLPIHPLILIFALTFQFHACLHCLNACILINCLLLVLWDFSKVLWQLYYSGVAANTGQHSLLWWEMWWQTVQLQEYEKARHLPGRGSELVPLTKTRKISCKLWTSYFHPTSVEMTDVLTSFLQTGKCINHSNQQMHW